MGGDLYEFIELANGRWGIALGDFSGHGLEAAMQMNFIKGNLLATAMAHADPAIVLGDIHQDFTVCRGSKQHFVTMSYGILDPHLRVFKYARAGDTRCLWRRRAELIDDKGGSFPVGWASRELFESRLVTRSIELEAGETLFLYTDGIPDARNAANESFDDVRLRETIGETDGLDAGAALDAVFSRVWQFIGEGRRPHDDMTMVVVRVDEPIS